MAAWARGARMASTLMCSDIEACSGCSAWTVTSTGGVASFLQPGRKSSGSAMAAAVSERMAIAGGEVEWRCCGFINASSSVIPGPSFQVRPLGSVIRLHGSRQCLQVGQRGLVANASVLARVRGGDKGRLRVHHFKHRAFAAGVAHFGESKALFGGGCTCVKRRKLIARGG